MKISLEWLSDFVDISGIDQETLAERLTMAMAEIEGVEYLNHFVDGILIGEIVKCVTISEAPIKNLVTVECGGKTFQSICTAPNARVGLKTVFAPAGSEISNGLVEEREIEGYKSEGVLCSSSELGWNDIHEIILECPDNIHNGSLLSNYVPKEDCLLDIDNKSLTHRPDLWGHYGIAREVAAILGRELRPIEKVDLCLFDDLPYYPISIDDPEDCPAYGCIELLAPRHSPAPLKIQRRLNAIGQRSISLLVDLTNYVMLEVGQPLHAFDADKLSSNIRVGLMDREQNFETLDGQTRKMLRGDLMIWSGDCPVAVAGVMGGFNSAVDTKTKKLLLEAANFRGALIRHTSIRLDLRSDASLRFEKNLPPFFVRESVGRFLCLLKAVGHFSKASSRFSFSGSASGETRQLTLPPKFLSQRAGTQLPDEKVTNILKRLGFQSFFLTSGELHVEVPPYRSVRDISIPEDIVEEVLRIYGYDNIPMRLPEISTEPTKENLSLSTEHKVRRFLSSAKRFIEVHTYAWFDSNWLETIGFIPPEGALELANPSTQQNKILRTTLIPNLLALIDINKLYQEDFRLFEIGKIFGEQWGDEKAEKAEASRLAGISFSSQKDRNLTEHFFEIKGALEGAVFICQNRNVNIIPIDNDNQPWQQAGCWGKIFINGREIGSLGIIEQPLLDKVVDRGQIIWFELYMDSVLPKRIYPEIEFTSISSFPLSWHDFSILWVADRSYGELLSALDDFEHTLVKRREFLTHYAGKGLPSGKISYTFRYWIGSNERTLGSEDIIEFRDSLMKFLSTKNLGLR